MGCADFQHKTKVQLRSRFTVFRVNETLLANRVSRNAIKFGEWKASTDLGGQISAEEYRRLGKAPLTEVALAISDPSGLTVVIVDSCEAYAVTPRKIAGSCLGLSGIGGRDVFDRRIKNKARKEASWKVLRDLHGENFSAMEKLAAAAD